MSININIFLLLLIFACRKEEAEQIKQIINNSIQEERYPVNYITIDAYTILDILGLFKC